MHRLALLLLPLLLAACSLEARAQQTRPSETPPPIAREFRGAWVATVDHIDFPSRPGLSAKELAGELDAIVTRAVDLRLNALLFQVRPAGDAFYRSSLEPWSAWLTGTQGKAPDADFDPLAHLIERCHSQGIQLHAWFNPFRCWHKASKGRPHSSHVTQQAPQLVVQHGPYQWLDPGLPLAHKWSLATVQEVLRRYDVDGIHVDDYFYPYAEGREFADGGSYTKYRQGGGRLDRAAWRRQNVDSYVEALYQLVHREKPWVQVGISPFGIARPGVPKGIEAGVDQFVELAADVPKWLREGWLDYLAPQLYWPIDQRAQSFPVLLDYWRAQNPRGRAIWPGLPTYRILAREAGFRLSELRDELAFTRSGNATGHVHYSFKALRSDAAPIAGSLRELYAEPALPPALPWLDATPPRAPVVRVDKQAKATTVSWQTDANAQFVAVQARSARGWRTVRIAAAGRGQCELGADVDKVVVSAIARNGLAVPQ